MKVDTPLKQYNRDGETSAANLLEKMQRIFFHLPKKGKNTLKKCATLSRLFDKNSLIISYCLMDIIKKIIIKHNSKMLNEKDNNQNYWREGRISLRMVIAWIIISYISLLSERKVNNDNNERIYVGATELNWKMRMYNNAPTAIGMIET